MSIRLELSKSIKEIKIELKIYSYILMVKNQTGGNKGKKVARKDNYSAINYVFQVMKMKYM